MPATITLLPGRVTLAQCRALYFTHLDLTIPDKAMAVVAASQAVVDQKIQADEMSYGVNTGFGLLAQTKIATESLADLQRNIVVSHAAGVGDYLNINVARLVMILKINTLAQGYSGVRVEVIEQLLKLYHNQVYPCLHSQGSVGASGDLAPLADLALMLIGEGQVFFQGRVRVAGEVYAELGLQPLVLAAKEGLALVNGSQVSTALALQGLFLTDNVFSAAMVAGALTVEATHASHDPFDQRVHRVRRQSGQIKIAAWFRDLLADSEIAQAHADCGKVQDPYCLRCQPQVMGACADQMAHVAKILACEVNAVTDNPLVFTQEEQLISAGNFHAEPVAMAADNLAIAIAELGGLAERRLALLMDAHFSGLPEFLVENSGLQSGFMIAQVTAAALVSENKSYAHPASVDSIPTSANQEDHVSMATFAAQRLRQMVKNAAYVVAIELLAAAQGLDFRHPKRPAKLLQEAHAYIRQHVVFYDHDRHLTPDIEKMFHLVYRVGAFNRWRFLD